MSKIKFSVLMSVYKNDNVDDVKDSIESLLNQTLMPDQIVIVADGPVSLELMDLLKHYEKNNIFDIHYRDKNIGLGLTLNEGLNYCKYDLVARMDADDICHQDRFEKQIGIFKNDKNIDLIGSNVDEYDEYMDKKLAIKKVPETDIEIKKYIKKRNPFNHMSVMYKKNKVLEAGSYLDCPLFEDYYLWCRMAKINCNFYNIQEPLMNVRTGLSMINRRGGFKYLKSIINFEKKLFELKFINLHVFIFNILSRTFVALIPNKLRYLIYKKILRK